MFAIDGKVVIITGASGGIGAALTESFGKLGAKMSLVSRTGDFKEFIVRHRDNFRHEPLALKADLVKEEDLDEIVKETKDKWGRIDVLINCAGVNIRKEMDEYTSEEWDKILDINLKSVFLLTNKVAHVMKKHSYGKIINISSIQGVICWGMPGKFVLGPYCASKAGLISLTKSFAQALAPYNINVNAICPAVIDGKWAKDIKEDPVIYEDMLRRIPLKRLAKNSDIVGPALFLASDDSSYVTGHSLMVDGGWTIE